MCSCDVEYIKCTYFYWMVEMKKTFRIYVGFVTGVGVGLCGFDWCGVKIGIFSKNVQHNLKFSKFSCPLSALLRKNWAIWSKVVQKFTTIHLNFPKFSIIFIKILQFLNLNLTYTIHWLLKNCPAADNSRPQKFQSITFLEFLQSWSQ